jgi:hypothetical protein
MKGRRRSPCITLLVMSLRSVICSDFNFVSSYSIVETNYNIIFGMIGFLVMSVFGGGSLI